MKEEKQNETQKENSTKTANRTEYLPSQKIDSPEQKNKIDP